MFWKHRKQVENIPIPKQAFVLENITELFSKIVLKNCFLKTFPNKFPNRPQAPTIKPIGYEISIFNKRFE